ncbi:hypothetical protein ACQEU6_24705 [Spirillospora sp. CA-108201]
MTKTHSSPELIAAARRLIDAPGNGIGWALDPSRSAEAMETVGRAMADVVRALDPEVLLTFSDRSDAVLAHIVARELGIRAVPFYLEEGVIEIDAGLVRGRRVVLMFTNPVRPLLPSAMHSAVTTHQAELVGITAVVGPPGATPDVSVPYLALVDGAEPAPDEPVQSGQQANER